jgi:hypothetical protein
LIASVIVKLFDASAFPTQKFCQLFVRRLGDNAPLDIQRGGGKIAPVPLPHFVSRLGIVVHVNEGVGDAMAIEETSSARRISAPVGPIDRDARPGAALLSGRWALYLHRAIIIAHEEVADAVMGLGDISLVAIAGADELAILHGIAGPLLSRAVGPAKGMSLPP